LYIRNYRFEIGLGNVGAATEALRCFPQSVERSASRLQNITVSLTDSSFMNVTFAVEMSSNNLRFISYLLLTRFVRWNVVLLLPPGDDPSRPDAVRVVFWCYSILVTRFLEASSCRHASCPYWDVVRPAEFHSSQPRTAPREKKLLVPLKLGLWTGGRQSSLWGFRGGEDVFEEAWEESNKATQSDKLMLSDRTVKETVAATGRNESAWLTWPTAGADGIIVRCEGQVAELTLWLETGSTDCWTANGLSTGERPSMRHKGIYEEWRYSSTHS